MKNTDFFVLYIHESQERFRFSSRGRTTTRLLLDRNLLPYSSKYHKGIRLTKAFDFLQTNRSRSIVALRWKIDQDPWLYCNRKIAKDLLLHFNRERKKYPLLNLNRQPSKVRALKPENTTRSKPAWKQQTHSRVWIQAAENRHPNSGPATAASVKNQHILKPCEEHSYVTLSSLPHAPETSQHKLYNNRLPLLKTLVSKQTPGRVTLHRLKTRPYP